MFAVTRCMFNGMGNVFDWRPLTQLITYISPPPKYVLYAYFVGCVSTLTPSNTRVREWRLHISTAHVGAGGVCSMCAFKTVSSLLEEIINTPFSCPFWFFVKSYTEYFSCHWLGFPQEIHHKHTVKIIRKWASSSTLPSVISFLFLVYFSTLLQY